MAKRPSNLPYLVTGVLAFGVIVTAWLGRDWFGAQFVQVGREAPDFEVATLEGETAALSDYRGQVVLLNIWATWCAPCRVEMPSMERLYRELGDDGFEIVAVSVDARQGEVDAVGRPGGNIRAFSDSLSLTFPILHDPDGRIQQLYQTTGVPESFVIGRDGVIYQKLIGPTEWDRPEHIEFFRRLLGEEPA